jgi:hypothetical protein
MPRATLLPLLASLTLSSTALAAAPTYVANFVAPATIDRVISSDRLWACQGTMCLAGGEATSPAKHICARLAKEIGAVSAFSFKGRAFTDEQLAACNARAGHILTPAAAR